MPVAYGALLGGMATLLTTSNLLLSDMLSSHGLPGFGLFSFLPVGGPIALIGIAYLAIVAPRLLTHQAPSDQWTDLQAARTQLPRTYALNQRLFDAQVKPTSPLVDTLLGDSNLGQRYGANVVAIIRGKRVIAPPSSRTRIHADDWLLMGARRKDAKRAGAELALAVVEHRPDQHDVLYANEAELAEIALPPHSTIVGKTLADLDFRERFGVNVLAIWREGRPWRSHLTDYSLQPGDGLLVHGTPAHLSLLGKDTGFLILTRLPDLPVASGKALIATTILGGFLIVVGLRWMPIALAALAAAVLVILSGCISIEQARANIRWQVVFLIAGMLPLAGALERAGVFASLADWLPGLFAVLDGRAVLFVIIIATALLTQFISNTAATLIIGPLAISTAIRVHLNPEAMAMAVAVGASSAFLSPISHPANLLVMSVGGYRFSDYARLGLPLLMLAAVGAAILIPLVFAM